MEALKPDVAAHFPYPTTSVTVVPFLYTRTRHFGILILEIVIWAFGLHNDFMLWTLKKTMIGIPTQPLNVKP